MIFINYVLNLNTHPILLLLHHQGPELMSWMHCSLKAYCATLFSYLCFLDVSNFRHQMPLCPRDVRDPRCEKEEPYGRV